MASRQQIPQKLTISSDSGEIQVKGSSSTEYQLLRAEMEGIRVGDIHASLVEHYRKSPDASIVEHCDMTALREDYLGHVILTLLVDRDPDDEYWPYSSLTLDLVDDSTTCLCLCLYQARTRDTRTVRSIVEDSLSRQGITLVSCCYVADEGGNTLPYWSVILVPNPSATIYDAFELRNLLDFLLQMPTGTARGKAPRRMDWLEARRVLLAGFPSYFLGQEESSWLEAKSREYDAGPAGEIELSQDVARFANGDGPGLLVIGFREKTRGGTKVIEKVTPVSVRTGIAAIYHKIVDRRVYPAVRGLQIEEIPIHRGKIVVFVIPEQQERDKPFLVSGAMVDGECRDAFISIVRRRGEHSIPVTPAAIHAALSAGRAAIQSREQGEN